MALIFELVGRFVLNAVRQCSFSSLPGLALGEVNTLADTARPVYLRPADFKMYDYRTHQNAYAITFIAAIGGLTQAILLIIFDLIYMKSDDAMGDVSNKGYLDEAQAKKVNNISEGGVLTYRKLRTHAVTRILIWPRTLATGLFCSSKTG